MHIKKGIKFLLHKRAAGQTTNLAIRMRVTLHGERPLDFPLRQNVDAADWNADTMRALPSCPVCDDINRTIDEWTSVCNEIFARYELIEKRVPTPGEIKDLFNDMVGRKTQLNDTLHHRMKTSSRCSICSRAKWARKTNGRTGRLKSSPPSGIISQRMMPSCRFHR